MFPMLIYVMPNAYQKVHQEEQHCYTFVGGLKEMLYDFLPIIKAYSVYFLLKRVYM